MFTVLSKHVNTPLLSGEKGISPRHLAHCLQYSHSMPTGVRILSLYTYLYPVWPSLMVHYCSIVQQLSVEVLPGVVKCTLIRASNVRQRYCLNHCVVSKSCFRTEFWLSGFLTCIICLSHCHINRNNICYCIYTNFFSIYWSPSKIFYSMHFGSILFSNIHSLVTNQLI